VRCNWLPRAQFSQLLNLCVFVATSSDGLQPFPRFTMATTSTTLLHSVGFVCTDGAATREALAAGYKFFDLTASKEKLTEVRSPHKTEMNTWIRTERNNVHGLNNATLIVFTCSNAILFIMSSLRQVGAVLQAAATAGGETARPNLCITAKLGLDESVPNKVEAACRSILTETGLDYLDCFVMQPVQSIKVFFIYKFAVLTVFHNCDVCFPAHC